MDKRDEGVLRRTPEEVTPEEVAPWSRRDLLSRAGLAATAALLGCGHQPPTGKHQAPAYDVQGSRSLKAIGATHGLLTGCAVNTRALREDKPYADLVAGQSSILVAENAMKWQGLHPAPDTYTFDEADGLMAFAERHRIKLRGHNLCWHRSIPKWVTSLPAGQGSTALCEHIEHVAGRYSGRMHSWDVINEAIEPKDGRPDGLRNSPWLTLAGSDYIELAFKTARAADPTALLCYNDYGLESETEDGRRKRQAVLLLLHRLKTRGIPIDAIGIQAHLTAASPTAFGPGLMQFLHECRILDLQVFITELDVNDRHLPPDPATRDAAVADTYARFLDLILAEPAVMCLLTWGITDKYTWLNSEGARPDHLPERCLPFDAAYHPKPAFATIRSSIARRDKPVTRT
jgi:endo-1,4-beta-xylanase